ncbi:MAG TPA: hypothetical protein VNF29_11215 [Candidatus Binataceae bacterium]|nr:hypothetical protein [Candidatus Binataceae bacterium]
MGAKRTHIILPEELAAGIDAIVGQRGRSRFIVRAASDELRRQQQHRALEAAGGAWKDRDHPELARGARTWVARMRADSDQRLSRGRRAR